MRHKLVLRAFPLFMAALLLAVGCSKIRRQTPEPALPEGAPPPHIAQLWSEPDDISRRDLFHGPGGQALTPTLGGSFTFLAKDTTGFSPGWDVRDASGLEWDVKLGPEAQSEVVASRLAWAIGYHQPPTYYVHDWTLVGGDEPGPQPPGRFRPALPSWKKEGSWAWARNPFVDTPPYRGLVVLMHMLGNWDLLDDNTALYSVEPPVGGARSLYIVRDLGASLGKTRTLPGKATRNDVDDFERQGFIRGVDEHGHVEFDDTRWYHAKLYTQVRPADVRWTSELLARLTPQQWRDAFRAARYEPAVADRFIRRLREKVRIGRELPDPLLPPAGER
ncbi:MAG TPA: hypothetical protein VMR21_14020 [Vicinamibacteria bacterium]|nr:hypothetical protein [Vicinamibacteria bacterium]